MGKHGTATEWTVGQIGEALAIMARSLGPVLKNRDPKDVLRELGKSGERLTDGLSGLISNIMQNQVGVLRRLTDKPLEIRACDGTRIIAEQKNLFQSGIDVGFRSCGADKKGSATKAAKVSVYEVVEDATFADMFAFLSKNLDELCFEQDQIISFIEGYRWHLGTDGVALFPFRCDGKFFVANVIVDPDDRLGVILVEAEYSGVWGTEHPRRLVVPCLQVGRAQLAV